MLANGRGMMEELPDGVRRYISRDGVQVLLPPRNISSSQPSAVKAVTMDGAQLLLPARGASSSQPPVVRAGARAPPGMSGFEAPPAVTRPARAPPEIRASAAQPAATRPDRAPPEIRTSAAQPAATRPDRAPPEIRTSAAQPAATRPDEAPPEIRGFEAPPAATAPAGAPHEIRTSSAPPPAITRRPTGNVWERMAADTQRRAGGGGGWQATLRLSHQPRPGDSRVRRQTTNQPPANARRQLHSGRAVEPVAANGLGQQHQSFSSQGLHEAASGAWEAQRQAVGGQKLVAPVRRAAANVWERLYSSARDRQVSRDLRGMQRTVTTQRVQPVGRASQVSGMGGQRHADRSRSQLPAFSSLTTTTQEPDWSESDHMSNRSKRPASSSPQPIATPSSDANGRESRSGHRPMPSARKSIGRAKRVAVSRRSGSTEMLQPDGRARTSSWIPAWL
eukprot:gnl/TRDRNA2_/TRDRNA2_151444_c1_seq1.p1 gnl/TRDRNA2_/TRDRNA2_151444_c1~~gnl/TRDRNA2_/TRDRNA2_151444_c1_seq1.p1  ORF type:complete len:503 (-),score=62.90 gnl/TRDRNA2_/TRDRNA2_151444_c1_seq1:602-1948(-)